MTIDTMPARASFDTRPQSIQPMDQPSMLERASGMFNESVGRAKAHPYAAAAIAGGVAAAVYGGTKLAQTYSNNRQQPRSADGQFKAKS